MYHTVKTALDRRDTGLWNDVAGGLSLAVIFYGALHLPVIV
ncbi:hypothetical protein [Citreimonas sp.]